MGCWGVDFILRVGKVRDNDNIFVWGIKCRKDDDRVVVGS